MTGVPGVGCAESDARPSPPSPCVIALKPRPRPGTPVPVRDIVENSASACDMCAVDARFTAPARWPSNLRDALSSLVSKIARSRTPRAPWACTSSPASDAPRASLNSTAAAARPPTVHDFSTPKASLKNAARVTQRSSSAAWSSTSGSPLCAGRSSPPMRSRLDLRMKLVRRKAWIRDDPDRTILLGFSIRTILGGLAKYSSTVSSTLSSTFSATTSFDFFLLKMPMAR